MPKGIPNKRYTPEFKKRVVEAVIQAGLSYQEVARIYEVQGHDRIAQCCRLMQIQHLHYAVDLDIHGFFDNVNHGKLIRQMWKLGIRDKKLLCIIKQMLKAPIVLPNGKRVYPTKGTPQGGILSPL